MVEEKSVIGIKFHKDIESEGKETSFPILNVSMENFGLGNKLSIGEFIDTQVLKLFREQGEHIKAWNLIEAIFLGDNSIYKDTLKCAANFIIANPSIRNDLEKLINNEDNDLTNKTCLYSNLVNSNEIICIHSDELMFPAHLESNLAEGSFVIKMDNPCLIKVVTFSEVMPKLEDEENKE